MVSLKGMRRVGMGWDGVGWDGMREFFVVCRGKSIGEKEGLGKMLYGEDFFVACGT